MGKIQEAERRLAAILLLIKTNAGFRHVCHWPPGIEGWQDGDTSIMFGYRTDVLVKLLGAEQWSNSKKVEITLADLTFMCHSVYLHNEEPSHVQNTSENGTGDGATKQDDQHSIEMRQSGTSGIEFSHTAQSVQSDSPEAGTSVDSGFQVAPGAAILNISMFQLVFILHSGQSARQDLTTQNVFEHVAKPLGLSMQRLQDQDKWLEKVCRNILVKQPRKQTPSTSADVEIAGQPSNEISWAFKEIYDKIEHGRIASIRLAGLHLSLQIPLSLVDKTEASQLQVSHLAILLLEDKVGLLEELDHDPASAALAYFITNVVPTKSLSKLATKLNLHLDAIVFLAKHLVKWRKARLIPPLHARNTYVINPDAPMEQLPTLELEYSKKFPALPTLQDMLGKIGAPIPIVYGASFPSRAHRDIFMDILAWLTRHGLAIRLRTIGWLCVNERHSDQRQALLGPDTEKHSSEREAQRIVTDPTSLSAEHKRMVRRIMAVLKDHNLDSIFTKVLAHLDGEQALEDIASQEGLKRAKVEECLQSLRGIHALRSVQCL